MNATSVIFRVFFPKEGQKDPNDDPRGEARVFSKCSRVLWQE